MPNPEDKNEAVRRSEGERHIDLFSLSPMSTYAELIERVPPDDERVERFWRATYVGASAEPHSDAECPFRERPIIKASQIDRPLTASQQPEDGPTIAEWCERHAQQPERPQLGDYEERAKKAVERLNAKRPQPERPQPDEREWTLVGPNPFRNNHASVSGSVLQNDEQITVVPKSSYLAQRQRAEQMRLERDREAAVAVASEVELLKRAEQAEAKVRELEGVLADLLAITRSARPREQHRRAVVLRAVRVLSPGSQGEK